MKKVIEWETFTTAGGVNATYADGNSRAAVAGERDMIVDRVHRRAWDQDSSKVPSASLVNQHAHAQWDARAGHVARAGVARAANLAVRRPSRNRRANRPRVVSHTPVVLLSAPRRRCCTSIRFPRIQSPTFVDRPTSPMAVDLDYWDTFVSMPFQLHSLSSAAVSSLRTCKRDPFHLRPTASPGFPSALKARTPEINFAKIIINNNHSFIC